MNLSTGSPRALALATALSVSACAEPPRTGASNKDSLEQGMVAFHVIGLMKTKSGAT